MPLAGDIVQSTDSARPLVRLVQQVAQAVGTSDTALTFAAGSEEIDTHGWHDEVTTNTRITCDRSGYVRLTGTVLMTASTTITVLTATISKNGAVLAPRSRQKPAATSAAMSQTVSVVQACAAGDYFELLGTLTLSSGTSANTNVGGSFASTFEAEYLRPL